MTQAQTIQEPDFQKAVLESPIPVMVEFSAVWCVPCKMLDPLLDQLAGEWTGRVRFVKLDVDTCAELAMRYGVMSVPTVILFKAGQPLERLSGYQPKDKIKSRFESHI